MFNISYITTHSKQVYMHIDKLDDMYHGLFTIQLQNTLVILDREASRCSKTSLSKVYEKGDNL